jgi:hypothetical protein
MKTLHKRCAGLDVHKAEVVACVRLISKRKVEREVRRFPTTAIAGNSKHNVPALPSINDERRHDASASAFLTVTSPSRRSRPD